MRKVFLFIFRLPQPGDEDAILKSLDSRPEIINWHAAFPNGAFLVSETDSDVLRDVIHQQTGLKWFIVAELRLDEMGKNVSGWLPSLSWQFLQKSIEQDVPLPEHA